MIRLLDFHLEVMDKNQKISHGFRLLLPNPLQTPQWHEPYALAWPDSLSYDDLSRKDLKKSKYGFWGLVAKKAKAILNDDNIAQPSGAHGRAKPQSSDVATKVKRDPHYLHESHKRVGSPIIKKGLDVIASSLNYFTGIISNALEEGLTVVENQTADIIQETRKLRIRRKDSPSQLQNDTSTRQQPSLQIHLPSHMQANHETQLKASRDVVMAMATKAKLLLRELKTVKANLAFARERCAQLEKENKILRESREKGSILSIDSGGCFIELIVKLQTLLAEKARLAYENCVYARENHYLREVVEYHQLTCSMLYTWMRALK
ncbi:hypothetical protein RJ641_004833, partial [Dillenia turbinata]